MCLSGRGAKELTQDSLFSPKLYPVLAFGVGRPSRAPLVTGVRAHVGSLEVGMGEGMSLFQQVAPLYPEPGGCRERLCDYRCAMEEARACQSGLIPVNQGKQPCGEHVLGATFGSTDWQCALSLGFLSFSEGG